MMARGRREAMGELQWEYWRLYQENVGVAEKMMAREMNGTRGGWRYRKGDRRMRVPARVVPGRMERALQEYNRGDELDFLGRLARLMGEMGVIRPFGREDEAAIRMIVDRQLVEHKYPPVGKWGRGETARYWKAVRRYYQWGKVDGIERLLEVMVMEALRRWISDLSGGGTVTLKRWAREQGMSVNAARNRARRQTISAFRKDGRWVVMK